MAASIAIWNNDSVRQLERSSIREYMERNQEFLQGRVLDFGAGKQPYRDLVRGEYTPYEPNDVILRFPFDCIMCNQVFQYIWNPLGQLEQFHRWLRQPGGYLVMTYPTNWDEVETTDLWRFTKAGMEFLLKRARFRPINHERRAEINLNGFKFPLGYGLVAQAS